MIGQTLGHYRVIEEAGSGGMGVVYRARDIRLDRDVALKIIRPGGLNNSSARERFRKEALVLSKLCHPNIAQVYDFDSQEGVEFLVMEYVKGDLLSSAITSGQLPEETTINIGIQIASALENAAEEGIVHRDLKPSNTMITTKGNIKVLDFGLARLLRTDDANKTESIESAWGAVGTLRKTVENILLTLSSLLRTARAWDYACGSFSLSDLTLPRNGVKKEQRYFTAEETGRIIFGASEPFATIWALTAMLGLRVGEVLALRVSDLDFERKIIRVRQSLDSATRKVQACKSNASVADVPMPPQLETRLLRHIANRQSDADLLFVNKNGRPYSANNLREKQLHPLLKRLGIPRGGFHAARHRATSEMLASGVAPTVVQKQMRHSDARITLGIYGHVVGDAQRRAVEDHAEHIEKNIVQ
jgi:serine/threonine protein kinase